MRVSSVRTAAQVTSVNSAYRPADRLRALARDVRRIGDGYRDNPEAIATAKDEIAHELVMLARGIDGGRR